MFTGQMGTPQSQFADVVLAYGATQPPAGDTSYPAWQAPAWVFEEPDDDFLR